MNQVIGFAEKEQVKVFSAEGFAKSLFKLSDKF
jgi:hypothetical protein